MKAWRVARKCVHGGPEMYGVCVLAPDAAAAADVYRAYTAGGCECDLVVPRQMDFWQAAFENHVVGRPGGGYVSDYAIGCREDADILRAAQEALERGYAAAAAQTAPYEVWTCDGGCAVRRGVDIRDVRGMTAVKMGAGGGTVPMLPIIAARGAWLTRAAIITMPDGDPALCGVESDTPSDTCACIFVYTPDGHPPGHITGDRAPSWRPLPPRAPWQDDAAYDAICHHALGARHFLALPCRVLARHGPNAAILLPRGAVVCEHPPTPAMGRPRMYYAWNGAAVVCATAEERDDTPGLMPWTGE